MRHPTLPGQLRPVLLLLLLTLLGGCGSRDDGAAVADPEGPPPWPAFAERFVEEYFEAQPFFAVQAGRHEFDGRMPDWSAAGIEREIERLRRVRREALRYGDEQLQGPQRYEREYVLSVIDEDLFWLERARFPFVNPAWYIDQLDPHVYLSLDYAPLEQRMAGYVGYARAIPGIATSIRSNLRTPLPKTYVERAIAAFDGFARFYREDVPQVFAPVQDRELQRQFATANEAAAQAMSGLADWFEAQLPQATDDFALGPELFAEMLRATEGVATPLEELMAVGRADLERNLAALREACAKFAPGRPLEACIAKMDANKPEGGPVAGAQAQLAALREFVEAQRIVTIPGTEEARVAEAPPYRRANFAYINIPGPYDEGLPSTYYIAPPDPDWSIEEQREYLPGAARLLYTSVHEVWPGHFLQFLHSNRHPSRIASLWIGYAYAEGWAHYTEEMMWELGLGGGDPEQHVGQLLAALLRNVRFISAIGLHTQGMTLEESERLFREAAFADPGNARQQAARGTYDPGYLNYTLGKLMIRKLRADWLARHSQDAARADEQRLWRAFHDGFLSYGGPPIPLVRRMMVGEGGSLF